MNRVKVKGRLKSYIKWPLMLSVLIIVMNVGLLAISIKAALFMSVFTIIYVVTATIIYFSNKGDLLTGLVDFATSYGQVQRQLLKQFVLPYALMDDTGRFIWQNEAFDELFERESLFRKSVTSLIPELTKDKLPINDEDVNICFSHEGKDFRATLRQISLGEMMEGSPLVDTEDFDGTLIAMFLFDETEINEFKRKYEEETFVTGIIYLDNYDEALESVEEVRRSLLTALIDRKINKYFSAYDAIVRKTETDKYFVGMKTKAFEQLVESRFDILEEVKTVNIGNDMAVTLSIGFGVGAKSFSDGTAYAKNAIDLALGRGGDQAVVKSSEKITYYGGKSQQIEKTTRVKARVKAHALRELIEGKDRVIVMGHSMSDVDSFGAGVGIYRASTALGKKCNIVINEVTTAIRAMVDTFVDSPEYEEGTIVSSGEALSLVDSQTVLVVVDTNRPTITECPELLNVSKNIVVLDHHRQGSERIENAVLSYIEPYASSACEMVAEILQYISDNVKIKSVEADCLYAGILIDTNNFVTKTGVRTFEAAAFLRRNGADVTRVRKLFRNEIEDYKARAEAVRVAELYRDEFAISVCPANGLESPTIIGAQAANELLNINLVRASFVLTEYMNKVFISARSIDEVNVQLIMERLGGGGHLNAAGVQIENHSVEEVIDLLKETIDIMIEEEAI